MQIQLPKPIQDAIESKKEFFWGEDGAEWKLKVETDASFVEKIVGCQVLIFANNGYGDYLFLHKESDSIQDDKVFAFYHETKEVGDRNESLRIVLGLETLEPSKDSYPRAVYESGQHVNLGDKVQFKAWLFFWKGWMEGTVEYVPGISPRNHQHEYDGLKWLSIKGQEMIVGPVVDPKTGVVKRVRLVERESPKKQL